jgi:dTDP-4-dehydrorhamnose reductase
LALSGRLLLVSPDGMLGRAWKRLLTAQNIEHDTVLHPEFDLTDRALVQHAITPAHRWVVNCSAFTDVDGAEKREPEAFLVNAAGVGYLAEQCREVGATLVHYSTDYVFDGAAAVPYPVDAPHDPINAYGRSKAEGERLIVVSGVRHLTVRTSWLYAPWANNFVRTMARMSLERAELRVVNDQRGRPTSAEQLANATLGLLERSMAATGADGIFHVTDGGECTWFEFAQRIVRATNPECRVVPCTTAEFLRPARRPSYSVLDLSKVERVLGPRPSWQECVDDVLGRLEPLRQTAPPPTPPAGPGAAGR